MTLPCYEVYALRFAHTQTRAKDNFLSRGDIHDGSMQLDFFIWAIRHEDRVIVVDTGFDHEASRRRNRPMLRHPVEALASIGIDAAQVKDVVISHMHYDHAGNTSHFPRARFHLQESEMSFATGPCMCHPVMRSAMDAEDVVSMVRHLYADRVCFHDGDAELAPGVSLHCIHGHTGGMQVVRVHTERGWVVLASDAAHFYDNMRLGNPFAIVLNVGDVLRGNGRMLALAASSAHLVPGHDPEVLKIYPSHPQAPGEIACLHLPPSHNPLANLG